MQHSCSIFSCKVGIHQTLTYITMRKRRLFLSDVYILDSNPRNRDSQPLTVIYISVLRYVKMEENGECTYDKYYNNYQSHKRLTCIKD